MKKLCVLALAAMMTVGATGAMADHLDDIKAKGKLVVGSEVSFAPFEFYFVDENGQENDMYAATYTDAGKMELRVTLRSETSGVRTWRLYLDGNFKSEATAVLQ